MNGVWKLLVHASCRMLQQFAIPVQDLIRRSIGNQSPLVQQQGTRAKLLHTESGMGNKYNGFTLFAEIFNPFHAFYLKRLVPDRKDFVDQ